MCTKLGDRDCGVKACLSMVVSTLLLVYWTSLEAIVLLFAIGVVIAYNSEDNQPDVQCDMKSWPCMFILIMTVVLLASCAGKQGLAFSLMACMLFSVCTHIIACPHPMSHLLFFL